MLKRCYFSDNGESLLEWFFPDADERLVERGRKFGRGERELSEEENLVEVKENYLKKKYEKLL